MTTFCQLHIFSLIALICLATTASVCPASRSSRVSPIHATTDNPDSRA